MSAHGPSSRHAFVHEDAPPLADRWNADLDSDEVWRELNLADLIRQTPIQPTPFQRNR